VTPREALEQLYLLATTNPGVFYKPGPRLGEFILSPNTRNLARAASQAGKSFASAKRLDLYCRNQLPWQTGNAPVHVGVLLGDIHNLGAAYGNALWEVCDRPSLHPDCHFVPGVGWRYKGRIGMAYRNGSHVSFKSGSGPPAALEGATYHAVVVDEIPKEDQYYAMVRGLRDGGHLWWSTTVVGRPAEWAYRRIEGDPETGAPPLEEWEQFVVPLSVEQCPWLTEADVQERIDKTAPHEQAQRIGAAWFGPARERVFSNFTDECILDSDPAGTYSLAIGVDHGAQVAHQVAVLVAYNASEVIVLDEAVNATRGTTSDEDARDILAMVTRRGASYSHIRHWTGDSNVQVKGGWRLNDLLSAAIGKRLRLRAGPEIGVPRKKAGMVDYRERVLDTAFSAGKLRVHSRCKHLIRSLFAYEGGNNDPSKDAVDAAAYAVLPRLLDITTPGVSALWLRN